MKIIPLGTNGFFASFGRQTACFAIPYGKTLIIVDAGSGLFRLAEKEGKALLKGKEKIHLFLSHYHLDHTIGFYAAFKLLKNLPVTVFAPSGRQVFSEFISLKYFPIDYHEKHLNFSLVILKEEERKIGDYQVRTIVQNHRGEVSMNYRYIFNNGKHDFTYITDSEPSRKALELTSGTNVILHEHEQVGKDFTGKPYAEQISDGHVTDIGAAMLAKRTGAEKLYLIHHSPFHPIEKLAESLRIAKGIFPATKIALDLKPIAI